VPLITSRCLGTGASVAGAVVVTATVVVVVVVGCSGAVVATGEDAGAIVVTGTNEVGGDESAGEPPAHAARSTRSPIEPEPRRNRIRSIAKTVPL
jgi:hypothetical protein